MENPLSLFFVGFDDVQQQFAGARGARRDALYGERDVVLVTDTSFLVRFAKSDVWAYQALLVSQQVAKSEGGRWSWLASWEVVSKYNQFRLTRQRDDDGLLLAPCSIEDMFGSVDQPIMDSAFSFRSRALGQPGQRRAFLRVGRTCLS